MSDDTVSVDLSDSSSATSSSTSTLAASTSVKDLSIDVSASGSVRKAPVIVIPVPPPPPPRAPNVILKAIPKVKKAPVAPVGDRVQTQSRSYADVAAEGGAAGGSGIVR